MSARYMLDTNICIYLRQNRPPEVTTRFRQMQHGDAVISVITYGELLYGAERSQQRTRALESLGRLVSLLPVVALPGEAATAYSGIRPALEARGEMIGGIDLWIAAHAKSAELTLVTNNEREFKRVPADLSSRTGPAAVLDSAGLNAFTQIIRLRSLDHSPHFIFTATRTAARQVCCSQWPCDDSGNSRQRTLFISVRDSRRGISSNYRG